MIFSNILQLQFNDTCSYVVVFFSEGINEETIRRYLARKPMTAKELVQKFKSKKLNMSNEQMTSTIAQLLKKINPERSTINNTMYLSLKKTE